MLYRVRFEYGRNIDASSRREAIQKMCDLMKAHPESFIRDVVDALSEKNPKPIWKRLITG